MADYLIQDTTLTGIADAIRGKTGGADPIPVSGMAGAISGIQTGGGGLPSGGAPYQYLVTDGSGNTKWEDRLAYYDSRLVVDVSETMKYVKVSDEIPSWASIDVPMKVWTSNGTIKTVTHEQNIDFGNGSFVAGDFVPFITTDNVEFNGLVFPEKGVYFASVSDNFYVTGAASADSDTPEITWDGNIGVIKKIDDKFLPDMGGGLLIIDVDMSSMTTSLSTDEVLLAMSEGKYPVLKVPVTKNDVMYLPFVCKSINGYSFCGYVYANGEWQLIGVAVRGNKIIKKATNQFSGVDIMHSANALRIKSTDGQKTFAIVVDGDGTIRAEEVN